MANEYLVQIHDFITERLAEAEAGRATAARLEEVEAAYFEGRLAELTELRQRISAHYDLQTQEYY